MTLETDLVSLERDMNRIGIGPKWAHIELHGTVESIPQGENMSGGNGHHGGHHSANQSRYHGQRASRDDMDQIVGIVTGIERAEDYSRQRNLR